MYMYVHNTCVPPRSQWLIYMIQCFHRAMVPNPSHTHTLPTWPDTLHMHRQCNNKKAHTGHDYTPLMNTWIVFQSTNRSGGVHEYTCLCTSTTERYTHYSSTHHRKGWHINKHYHNYTRLVASHWIMYCTIVYAYTHEYLLQLSLIMCLLGDLWPLSRRTIRTISCHRFGNTSSCVSTTHVWEHVMNMHVLRAN